MKVAILAGGFGTRLQEVTTVKPKPMVEIGGIPALWHIMKIYSAHGFNEFLIALGYKGDVIKQYFLNYYNLNHDLTVKLDQGKPKAYGDVPESWTIHLVDTGLETQTGGRLKRLQEWVGKERFMVTYGDGLADVNIQELVEFHKKHGKLATVTAVRPPARFGALSFDGDRVSYFAEKPQAGEGWINGGFFVFEPGIFDFLTGDDSILERDPMERLARDGQLMAYRHAGFWQCMDTVRDVRTLENLWQTQRAPWKIWK